MRWRGGRGVTVRRPGGGGRRSRGPTLPRPRRRVRHPALPGRRRPSPGIPAPARAGTRTPGPPTLHRPAPRRAAPDGTRPAAWGGSSPSRRPPRGASRRPPRQALPPLETPGSACRLRGRKPIAALAGEFPGPLYGAALGLRGGSSRPGARGAVWTTAPELTGPAEAGWRGGWGAGPRG